MHPSMKLKQNDLEIVMHQSWLSQKPCSDIAHFFFIQLIILPIQPVNSNVLESANDSFDVKSHTAESVD